MSRINKFFSRSWAIIDLDIIRENVRILKSALPEGCRFLAVIKAEGYGMGMVPVAKACMEGGTDWFGVATIKEALELREAGITLPILILGITPPDWAEELANYGFAQVVPSLSYAELLSKQLVEKGKKAAIHIKIDTGMGRLGWYATEQTIDSIQEELLELAKLPGLQIEGMLTHLPVSRDSAIAAVNFTQNQIEVFRMMCEKLENAGVSIPIKHVLNSGGIINYPQFAMDMVRAGHILFENISPFISRPHDLATDCAIEIKSSIAHIKEVPVGTTIGYGRTWTAARPTRVGVLGLGYCDGYNAVLSNCGKMLLKGKYAPVIGRVCMDQMMIDVTDIEEAKVGDIVTVVGREGNERITMNDVLMQATGIMNAPISCCLTNRMDRYYRKDGKIVASGEARFHFDPV